MPTPVTDASAIDGVVNLYKPAGRSSAHYVYRLRPILNQRKVGHAGTLDPFAEGVLIACVGKATKLVERIMNLPKRYRTTIRLDVTNDTFDTEQPFVPITGPVPPSRDDVESAVAKLVGTIQQVPPVFSAIRVGGRFSYHLAKQGRPIEHKARSVTIYDITIESYQWPRLELTIRCGRGTYIRAIARDLGQALACGGACETLLRESVGPFVAEDALNILEADPAQVRSAVIPIEQAARLIENLPGSDFLRVS